VTGQRSAVSTAQSLPEEDARMRARVVASTSLTRSSMSGPPRDNPGRTAVRSWPPPLRSPPRSQRDRRRSARPKTIARHEGQHMSPSALPASVPAVIGQYRTEPSALPTTVGRIDEPTHHPTTGPVQGSQGCAPIRSASMSTTTERSADAQASRSTTSPRWPRTRQAATCGPTPGCSVSSTIGRSRQPTP
jgi:hypothetical protein